MSHKVAEAARGTSEEVNRFFLLPTAAEGGLHDAQQAVAGLVEGVVQTNLRAAQELFRLTNPAAVLELQQRFVREYLGTLMQGTTTLVRAVRRTADETLRPPARGAGGASPAGAVLPASGGVALRAARPLGEMGRRVRPRGCTGRPDVECLDRPAPHPSRRGASRPSAAS